MKTNNRKQTKLIPTMHKANKMWVESNGYREQNIESIKRKENKEILYVTMNNRHRLSQVTVKNRHRFSQLLYAKSIKEWFH